MEFFFKQKIMCFLKYICIPTHIQIILILCLNRERTHVTLSRKYFTTYLPLTQRSVTLSMPPVFNINLVFSILWHFHLKNIQKTALTLKYYKLIIQYSGIYYITICSVPDIFLLKLFKLRPTVYIKESKILIICKIALTGRCGKCQ